MKNVNITINGAAIQCEEGSYIIDVVHANKLDVIPNLCYDKRLEPCTSCFLCVVEVAGVNRLLPSCSTKVQEGMIITTKSAEIRESRKTSLELLMSNHYADCIGPCKNNCPAGVDVQSYISLISMGKYKEALKLIKENNPLPLSVCRVCVRDCEAACRRNLVDEPVAVNKLKRFVADYDAADKWAPEIAPRKNKRVAVIGSGPAGLTAAYFLNKDGIDVTIFEKASKPGGMLRYGIPEYRLPKNVLDDEINWIVDLGVKLECGKALGKEFSIDDLFDSGFDSIFVAPGAHKGSRLGLQGEENVREVVSGIEFLRDIAAGESGKLKGDIVVVGGGNTAIDAARSALRCGADSVKIVYRRSIKEMPAHHEEIEAAQKEGIEIAFLTNPKSLVIENGRLTGIECLKMALESAKPGERPRPVPLQGSEFIINCDYIISAIGQNPDSAFTKRSESLTLNKWGNISVENSSLITSIPGVFAGGDAVTGPLTAISAIAQGKKAALSIMNYLFPEKAETDFHFYSFRHNLADLSEREFESVIKSKRSASEELAVSERISNFLEVESGLNEDQCRNETTRCLECGCSEYADCRLRLYCDEYHVDISNYKGEVRKYKPDNRHPFISLDPNKCINCGKCIKTCGEALKVAALGFVYRGFKSIVKPAMEKPLAETDCISCGNCIDVCPTGAIAEKFPFKILGTLPKEDISTVCAFCSVGCEVNYKKISDDIFYISNSTGESHINHNRGYLCSKGRFGHRYLLQKNRVFDPVIKLNSHHESCDLNTAVKFTERKLRDIINRYGRDSVAVMASPKQSNEELYLLQKFARTGLKTNNINSFSHLIYGEGLNDLDECNGITASTSRYVNIEKANVIVLVNTNLHENNLVMELKVKSAQKRGAKVILFNSSETRMDRYADLWIDNKKGTTAALLGLVTKKCLDYRTGIDFHDPALTGNYLNFTRMLSGLSENEILKDSGIDKSAFTKLVDYLTEYGSDILFLYDIDYKAEKSVNDLAAIGNYLLATGRTAKENNGIIILRNHCNSAGVFAMGAVPEYLPGYIPFDNLTARNAVESIWNCRLDEIFRPVDLMQKLAAGSIKALLIFGEDPLLDWNNKKYLSGVEFILAAGSFWNSTMAEADVILPLCTHIESEGSYTRCDNEVQKAKRVTAPASGFNNIQIISLLASRFAPGLDFLSVKEVADEIGLISDAITEKQEGGIGPFDYTRASYKVFENDYSLSEPFAPALHYQENYYITNVKKKII